MRGAPAADGVAKKLLEPKLVFLPRAGGLAFLSQPPEVVVVEAERGGGRRLGKGLPGGR